jgi:hypothetical protein
MSKGIAAQRQFGRTPRSASFPCFLVSLSLFCLFRQPTSLHAQTSYPMVTCLRPVAVQAGTTAEVEVVATHNLYGAYRVLVTGTGVTGSVEPPKGPAPSPLPQVGALKVRFQAAADALPGVRDVRVITPRGASTLGQLVVVRDPVVREAANNDTLATAQPIALPAAVCGAIEKAEDVDFYKFHVKAGTALTFHVGCQRLQNRIHDLQEHADPILTLRNSVGTVLAANDNFFFGDPLLHYRFAAEGDYFLEVRDTRYGGNPNWQYCIEIHDRPFVTNVFPPRVTPGVATRLRLVGHNLPADPTATVTVPADAAEGLLWAVLRVPLTPNPSPPRGEGGNFSPLSPRGRGVGGEGETTNVVPLVASRLPEVLEATGEHATADKAQPVAVPCGISGCIAKEGEVDCYAFEAKAGERFTFRVVARDCQSGIDSNLRILNAKGERLAENDDARDRFIHADSLIENWAAPAGGRYAIEVRDLHARGGPGFVYFLEVTRSRPSFTLELDTDKTLLAPGTAAALFARVTRENGFAGEVQLGVEGLPPGVTATCGRILADGKDGCILLQAAPGAKPCAANLLVTGTATHAEGKEKPVTLQAVARPLQEVYMPGGGRFHYPVEMHTLSIGDPLDLRSVKISPTAVTLKPGESKRIDVVVERAPGFKGNVTLDTVYQHLGTIYGGSMPPGVAIDDKASQTLLVGEQVKGHITLKAAADAKPVKEQLIPVMAHVSINFVMKFTCCGEPLRVTVESPSPPK